MDREQKGKPAGREKFSNQLEKTYNEVFNYGKQLVSNFQNISDENEPAQERGIYEENQR